MSRHEDVARVRFSLQLARQAHARGALAAARAALRSLGEHDFAGGPAVSASHLAVLRNHLASEADVREAVDALVALRPSGIW